jgi:hypothetical protein
MAQRKRLLSDPAYVAHATRRFFRSVEKNANGCWEWRGEINKQNGYGHFYLAGRKIGAHRAAFRLLVGPFDESLFVCHHCDNPPCVRPDHLFLGTQKDNLQDASRKGRTKGPHFIGSLNHSAKLSQDDVDEIRLRLSSGEMMKVVAAEHGISRVTARMILYNKSWKDLGALTVRFVPGRRPQWQAQAAAEAQA